MSMELGAINKSHHSATCMGVLDKVLGCAQRIIACSEYWDDGQWEVRATVKEADGSWYHHRLANRQHTRTLVRQQDVFPHAPCARSGLSVFQGWMWGNEGKVTIRPFNPMYIGRVANVKARYYRELLAHEEVARLGLPGIGRYLGCVLENGLVTGVAYKSYVCTLEQALASNVPCSRLRSKELVEAIIALQHLRLVRGPISPASIVVDGHMRLRLASIDCAFEGASNPADRAVGGKIGGSGISTYFADKAGVNSFVADKATISADKVGGGDAAWVADRSPLGPVFARLCSTVRVEERVEDSQGVVRSELRSVRISCCRSSCICSHADPLRKPVYKQPPLPSPHFLWVASTLD